VAAVNDVLGGGTSVTSDIARKVVRSFKQARLSRGETENLSLRERGVQNALAKSYNYKTTADLLGTGLSTMHAHIERIYQELHVLSHARQ